jgi:hypothetical protein
MKRLTGFAVAWLLYGAGHVVSRPMTWWGVCEWLYAPYNWLMLRSCDAQDWGRAGPWEEVEHG